MALAATAVPAAEKRDSTVLRGTTQMRLDGADLSSIETLVEGLAHPDEGRVLYAIDVLESLDKRNLVTPLLLHHTSAAVRARALAALGYGTQFCEDFDFSAEGRETRERPDASARTKPSANGRSGRAPRRPRVVDAPVTRPERSNHLQPRNLKVVRDRNGDAATAPQVMAIYSIARGQATLGEGGGDERCRSTYGCSPAELSKRQASEFIDLLRRPAGEASSAGAKA